MAGTHGVWFGFNTHQGDDLHSIAKEVNPTRGLSICGAGEVLTPNKGRRCSGSLLTSFYEEVFIWGRLGLSGV